MSPDLCIYAITRMYSRIVLRKISQVKLLLYRQVERNFKKLMKIKADITYLK